MLGTGLVVGSTCRALGIPGGLAMGAWAGLWVPVATLGPTLGFGPYFVVAVVQTDTSQIVALVIGAILCGVTATIRRRVNRRAGIFPRHRKLGPGVRGRLRRGRIGRTHHRDVRGDVPVGLPSHTHRTGRPGSIHDAAYPL